MSEKKQGIKGSNLIKANQELEFIQLGLRNRHVDHFRHFIDQYYCFKNGYVNRNGGASWDRIIFKEWVSKNAIGLPKTKILHKEHVVPLKVLKNILLELNNPTIEEIAKVLDANVYYATITKEEDSLLKKAGLNSTMPPEYFLAGHPFYKDPFARYKTIGLKLEKLVT